MKRNRFYVLLVLLLFLSGNAFAQNSGRGFDYRIVIRTPEGMLKAEETINLRFGLYAHEVSDPSWVETHEIDTDKKGIAKVRIGKGTKESAAEGITEFSDVDFETQGRWLKVEIKDADKWKVLSFAEISSAPFAETGFMATYPVGSIIPWPGSEETIPDGWMLCDGTQLSRMEYPALYSAIGTNWGYNSTEKKFYIPDLRGLFLTGSGNDGTNRSSLNTGGNTTGVGSFRTDEVPSHSHNYTLYGTSTKLMNSDTDKGANEEKDSTGNTTGSAGGSETRPRNVYVHYIIKY